MIRRGVLACRTTDEDATSKVTRNSRTPQYLFARKLRVAQRPTQGSHSTCGARAPRNLTVAGIERLWVSWRSSGHISGECVLWEIRRVAQSSNRILVCFEKAARFGRLLLLLQLSESGLAPRQVEDAWWQGVRACSTLIIALNRRKITICQR